MNINLEPKVFQIRSQKKRMNEAAILLSKENEEFNTLCNDPSAKINPKRLHFMPEYFWPDDEEYTFDQIVDNYFRTRNSPDPRFSYKLFNALILSSSYHSLSQYIGVSWLTDNVIKVNAAAFAMLLKNKNAKGSLFHAQGNFPTHGFIEITSICDAVLWGISESQLEDVDFDNVKIFRHADNLFNTKSSEAEISQVRYKDTRPHR